jgi:hypothetical protein
MLPALTRSEFYPCIASSCIALLIALYQTFAPFDSSDKKPFKDETFNNTVAFGKLIDDVTKAVPWDENGEQ